jgi:hypothetical protein
LVSLGSFEPGLEPFDVPDALLHKVACRVVSPFGRHDARACGGPRVQLEGEVPRVGDVEKGSQDSCVVHVAQTGGGAVGIREVDVVYQGPVSRIASGNNLSSMFIW